MIVGIVKESFPNEARVAMVPALLPQLAKKGIEVVIESGAGDDAGFLDSEYTAKGAKVVRRPRRGVQGRGRDRPGSLARRQSGWPGRRTSTSLRDGQTVIGVCEPLTAHEADKETAAKGVTLCSRWS